MMLVAGGKCVQKSQSSTIIYIKKVIAVRIRIFKSLKIYEMNTHFHKETRSKNMGQNMGQRIRLIFHIPWIELREVLAKHGSSSNTGSVTVFG